RPRRFGASEGVGAASFRGRPLGRFTGGSSGFFRGRPRGRLAGVSVTRTAQAARVKPYGELRAALARPAVDDLEPVRYVQFPRASAAGGDGHTGAAIVLLRLRAIVERLTAPYVARMRAEEHGFRLGRAYERHTAR